MAKISVAKSNRSERQERGPMLRNPTSRRTPAQRNSKRRMSAPYNNINYKVNVLARDNIRILEKDMIIKLDRKDESGQNILDLYYAERNRIICRREQTTETSSLAANCYRFFQDHTEHKASRNPDWDRALDESLTSQEKALEIDEYLFHSKLRRSARQRHAGEKRKPEQMFQNLLVAEVNIFQNLVLNEGDLEGQSNHKINSEIGPKHVIANIKDHIRPDYLCGYPNPESAFSITPEIWDKIPRSLCVLSPKADKTSECLFLPFLALELKWRERQAELEKTSNSVSTTPIFGLTGVERNFTLWVMFRYESTFENNVHYDMCELASYDLTSGDDVESFHAAMTNIHDWVENERKAHFMKCIGSINQNPIVREIRRQSWNQVLQLAQFLNLA
ncbi:uncharacterized protein DFL_009117 [Arthrobotrys flagrans]|uniref:Uncharacterized protein n=1 Tax=Arthrobotrys flagrans TaxID=97331 RepID=A0A436ZR16_ARTFL|nr:hypothetical protein DFL_009117 [Arthrobotrys flagrans]